MGGIQAGRKRDQGGRELGRKFIEGRGKKEDMEGGRRKGRNVAPIRKTL